MRYVAPGRELIDTMDAVMRYGFSTGDLPWRGLKAVARHFGIAAETASCIPGDRIHDGVSPRTRSRPPLRGRRRRGSRRRWRGFSAARRSRSRGWRRGATSGSPTPARRPASSIRSSCARICAPARRCPRISSGDRETHTGAALHLFATGVAHRVVKADVASLYPSLMRAYRIGPARDTLGAMLALVDRLVERRLDAKASGKAAPPGSASATRTRRCRRR